MKQIMTITRRLCFTDGFDVAVNQALADGWTLTSRFLSPADDNKPYYPAMWVAFLEKEDPDAK